MKIKDIVFGVLLSMIFVSWLGGMAVFEAQKPVLRYNLTIPSNTLATHYQVHLEYEGEGGYPMRENIKLSPIPENHLFPFSTKYSHITQLYCVFTFYEKSGDAYISLGREYKVYHLKPEVA